MGHASREPMAPALVVLAVAFARLPEPRPAAARLRSALGRRVGGGRAAAAAPGGLAPRAVAAPGAGGAGRLDVAHVPSSGSRYLAGAGLRTPLLRAGVGRLRTLSHVGRAGCRSAQRAASVARAFA